MALPLVVGALGGFFGNTIVKFVVKVLGALGIGILSYTGITELLSQAQDSVTNTYGQLPALVAGVLEIAQVPYAISVLFAAISFRAAASLTKRFGFKKVVP